MNKKSKIIVSIVGIAIVLLTLLGITYAYYLTRIQGNTNTNSISITTADLRLEYGDGNGLVTANDIMPGTTITKTFTVKNVGNSKVEGYIVVLEEIVNDLTRTEDLVYTLDCKINETTSCGTVEEKIFPFNKKLEVIFSNSIDIGLTQKYTLTVTYKNFDTVDQSEDMGSAINAKVNIYDPKYINPYKTGNIEIDNKSLQYHILNNKALVVDYDSDGQKIGEIVKPEIYSLSKVTGVADDAEESGIYMAQDDDGISYIYRGTIKNNYVSFVGYLWRIVRINGDGTIRIVLNGTTEDYIPDELNFDELMEYGNYFKDSIFNNDKYSENDNAYLGYMYGLTGVTTDVDRCLIYDSENDTITDNFSLYSTKELCEQNNGVWTTTAYEATHSNIKSSEVKKIVDLFYEANIKSNYSEYVANSTFCGDKSLYIGEGTGKNETYYGAFKRLRDSDEIVPSLKCNGKYSVYSVGENLTYPIALISANELVMAGAFYSIHNNKYYMYEENNINNSWWTMTPNILVNGGVNYPMPIIMYSDIESKSLFGGPVYGKLGVRPVINLSTKVLYDKGDGTENNPYILKLAS